MAMDLALVARVRDARDELLMAIVTHAPAKIQLPKAWVRHFQMMEDLNMCVPIGMHTEAVQMLGVALEKTCQDDADDAAILTLADGCVHRVNLGAP